MYIQKVIIENFKCFQGRFELELNKGLNILVGDNEIGKSTILEAIHLALSGWIYGKYLGSELNQSLFNLSIVKNYLSSLKQETKLEPPKILIELFFDIDEDNDSLKALFEGNGNSMKQKSCGVQFMISFNDKYQKEYDILLDAENSTDYLPIEFYEFSWSSFARDDKLTPKIIPFKSHLIDSSNSRYQNGSDVYISRIIQDFLFEKEKIDLSLVYRNLKGKFSKHDTIQEINKRINSEEESKKISDKNIALSVDLSSRNVWESSLTTYLDDIPFGNIGKGEQCLVKTKLALNHNKSKEANLLLLEEPENHLSHSTLNKLICHIKNNHKQIIISTHSSFVANKLGLSSLVLLNKDKSGTVRKTRIKELTSDTQKFFDRLAGYDTLRLLLCRKAILVEGASDELIVQKAYQKLKGKLPIEDEVDVISVGTAFLRFLEIAEKINNPVAVVTDNDGDFEKNVSKKYKNFSECETIKICADFNKTLNTLEPQIVEANKDNLDILRKVLGLQKDKYKDCDSIVKYMQNNKTDCALKIFDTTEEIKFPQYILDAINWEYE
jgi:putative ATP-dependent endonuclease of OLD family